MPEKNLNPIRSFTRTIGFLSTGRLKFPKDRVGQIYELDDETWIIFRQAVLKPDPEQPDQPGAIFQPRFHVKGMSPRLKILFSWLPIPFYVGLPGFRFKLWMFNESTGDFAGYYEWDTVEDAQNYSRSFAAKFMTRRSEPESVSFRIFPV